MSIKDIKEFCRNNRIMIFNILLFTILAYGFAIVHFSFSIDTEALVVKQMGFYDGWYGVDRYGLVFSKWLFGHLVLVPGYTWIAVAVLMAVAGILWEYHIYRVSGRTHRKYYGVLPVILFTSVNMLELLNFQCLSFEVMWGMVCCTLSVMFIYEWVSGESGRKALFLGLGFMVWAFGSYQAFVPLYITAALGSFLFIYQRKTKEGKPWICRMVLRLIGSFLAGYAIYAAIGEIIRRVKNIGEGLYTESMVKWGKEPIESVLGQIRSYIGEVITGEGVTWNYGYSIISIGLLCLLVYKFYKREETLKELMMYTLVVVGFIASPFFLSIVLGSAPVDRAQLAVPLVAGLGAELIIMELGNRIPKKKACMLLNVAILFIVYRNVVTTDNRLLYTDYMVYEQEKQFSHELIAAVEQNGGREGTTKVAVVGTWHPGFNPSMIQGETLGKSFYEWDAGVPGGTNSRIVGFWEALGYDYDEVTTEEYISLQERAAEMPIWPEEGSVVVEDGIAVVKISE